MKMRLANRKIIARHISNNSGYFQQDVEDILEKEEQALHELLEEGYDKIKIGKSIQIELQQKESEKAWDGIRKQYFQLPERKRLKIKPLNKLKETIDKINKELDNRKE